MNKALWKFAGEDPKILCTQCPSNRRRATAEGFGLLLIVLLWSLSLFQLSRSVFGFAYFPALLVGAVGGMAAYVVERIFLSLPSRRSCTVMRCTVGVGMAVILSTGAELAVLHPDIDRQVAAARRETSNITLAPRLDAAEKKVQRAAEVARHLEDAAICELNKKCPGNSGAGGPGPIYRALERDAERARAYLSEVRGVQALALQDASLSKREIGAPAGIMERVRALPAVLGKNPWSWVIYAALSFILFAAEFTVVGIRHAFGKTADDEIEIAAEAITSQQARDTAFAANSQYSRIRLLTAA